MHKKWKVDIKGKEEVTVNVITEDNVRYSYDYDYDSDDDEEDNADTCVDEFLESNTSLTLSSKEEYELKKYLEIEFKKHGLSDSEEKSSDGEDDKWADSFKGNCFYFSQFVLDKCLEKVSEGQTSLVPGVDGVPKNINLINKGNDKYYARISNIKVLHQCSALSLKKAFGKHPSGIAIIGFETRDNQSFVCFELEFAHESTDDRNIQFYKFSKNKTIDSKGNIYATIYSLNDCTIYVHSDSELAGDLTPALSFYSTQMDEINRFAETTQISIDLPLLRRNFKLFKSLIVDDDLLIIPIKGPASRLNGISVVIENHNGQKKKYDFYEGHLAPISKGEKENYKKALAGLDVQLPKGTDLAVLDFVELNDKDIYLFNSILIDVDNRSCAITNNVEGDRVRLKRIIRSIESVLSKKVVNYRLVETICKNSITFSCNPDLSYIPNEEYKSKLKEEYPILANNAEQIAAIDKIMQMGLHNIDVMLVQGPPGTGKTELILALAKELSKTNNNTLITSNVHVACDNIVERLKNNKDLVLKRYTTVKGEKYEQEIIENKRKYIENQVLEGFKYKDRLLNSKESFAGLKDETEELVQQKQKIIDSKAKYDEEIRKYNDLLVKSKELGEAQSNIKALIEQDQAFIESNKKQYDQAAAELSSVDLAISKQKDDFSKWSSKKEADEQDKAANINELNALCSQSEQKESVILNAKQENSALSGKIELLKGKTYQLKALKGDLEKINLDELKKDVLAFVVDGKPLDNQYYEMILGNSVSRAQEVFEIYKKLRSDTEFWNGTKTSLNTIEYLYFKQKKSPFSFAGFDNEIFTHIGELYDYLKSSKMKRNMMAFLPFLKINGKSRAYYLSLEDKVNRELKKIQFYRDDYIFGCIQENAPESKLDQLIRDTNAKIEKHLSELNALETQFKANESLIENTTAEIESFQQEIPVKTKVAAEKKAAIQSDQEELDKVSRSLDEAESRRKELQATISDLSNQGTKMEQDAAKHKAALEDNEKEIARNKNDIFVTYNEKRDLIENYDVFIKKLDIDIKNIEKNIAERSAAITRIENKVAELEKCGFAKDEAFELIFTYCSELNKIVNSKDEDIGHYFKGQGNKFNQIFLLNENSNGSLISMTTNQVASLLNNVDRDLDFDYAIIDEASKCSFEDIIISLPRIKHLVLIGDFMQLDHLYDPYHKIELRYQNMFTEDQWEALNKSSFSLLLSQFVERNEINNIESFDDNPYVAVMKRQYRMNKDIYHLIEPIYAIHKGFELIDEKQLTANDLKCITIGGHEIQPPQGFSYYNAQEGDAIVSFLKEFSTHRENYPKIKTIGIITGYKAQENYIRRKLGPAAIAGVQIGTFDRFQGREYDLVIVSLVRTDGLGFTRNVRRMNVAFSRAKNHLLIYGNFEALNKIAMRDSRKDDDWSNDNVKEDTFVAKKLIPNLYQLSKKDGLKENIVSDQERVESTLNFLKGNAYEQ